MDRLLDYNSKETSNVKRKTYKLSACSLCRVRKAFSSFLCIVIQSRKYAPSRLITRDGNGTPLQCSCLENPMDGGAWWAAVHGVVKSRAQLSNFPFTFHFHALEKEMATHSSVLAWRIPGTEELVGCRLRVAHSRTRLT